MDDKLRKINAAVGRFINKANKRNEPLEAFRDTESFKQLLSKLETALKQQAKWVAKNIDQIPNLDMEEPTAHKLDAEIGTWLARNMPHLGTYMAEDKAYQYLFNAFIYSVEAQLLRYGVTVRKSAPSEIQKASVVDFKLTNPHYIAALKNQSNYMLSIKSKIDETTRGQLITLVRDAKLNNNATIDEIAQLILDKSVVNSPVRAFMIANTETNQAMSSAQQAFITENNVPTKSWIPAGPSTCQVCLDNADDGEIPADADHTSGDPHPPAHPNCECYEEAGEIDLDSISLWDGE